VPGHLQADFARVAVYDPATGGRSLSKVVAAPLVSPAPRHVVRVHLRHHFPRDLASFVGIDHRIAQRVSIQPQGGVLMEAVLCTSNLIRSVLSARASAPWAGPW
jgi:hypothetical protein